MKPCLLWPGLLNDNGYGRAYFEGRHVAAHRAAYCEANNLTLADVEGVVIRHLCDVRACVEPTHLEPGTHADNSADMVARGRSVKGTAHHLSRLCEEDVKEIRSRAAHGEAWRLIGKLFGISKGSVQHIVSGRNWKHVS